MYEIKILNEVDDGLWSKLVELDKKVYDPKFCFTDMDMYKKYWTKNNKSFIFIMNEDNLLGCLIAYPLNEHTLRRIVEEELWTGFLPKVEDIEEYKDNETYDVFISSIIIDSDFRKEMSLNIITKMFNTLTNELSKHNIRIISILGCPVNFRLERFLINMGAFLINDSKEERLYRLFNHKMR